MSKPDSNSRLCSVESCERQAFAWGYCNMHRQRYQKYGDPLAVHKPYELVGSLPEEERRRRDNARSVAYYNENKQARLEYARSYREQHADYIRAYLRSYQKRNPDVFRANARNRKLRLKRAFVERVDHEAVFERDNWTCGICGDFVQHSEATLDHVIPVSKGGLHCYSNVQLAHAKCNRAKSDRLDYVHER